MIVISRVLVVTTSIRKHAAVIILKEPNGKEKRNSKF